MNQKYKTLQTYTLWAIDMICILVSYLIATQMRYGNRNDYGDKTQHYMVCVVFLLFCVIYTFLADWNRDFIKRGYILEFMSVIRVVAVTLVGSLVVVFFLSWTNILSIFVILNYIWIDIVLTFLARMIYKRALWKHISSEKNVTRVVVISDKEHMEATIKKLSDQMNDVGYKVVRAYCTDLEKSENGAEADPEPWYIDGVHVHSGIQDITSRLITDPFDEVFINTPNIPQKDMQDIILGFEEMGVTVHYNLELPNGSMGIAKVGEYNDYSVITYSMTQANYGGLFVKRLVDIVGGIVGLLITGIITLFLAPAIKLDSPGKVFFSQTRIGKNGRRFKIYKFRSMYADAEKRKKDLEALNEVKGLMFKMENDPRVTRVGAFIRKTSLDEFPQFLNVLKGDMSLVGTRPPTESEFSQYNEHYRRRLSMTPGLTGLWQISGRSDIDDFDEVVKLDLKYIDNWNLLEDVRILARTVLVVLFGKGAK
jgi:exopolysaccharide biosynthesis polyprenyl glycosylphosphotransferase